MKQKLKGMEETDNSTNVRGDFNTPLSVTDITE